MPNLGENMDNKPIFIKIDQYKDMKEVLGLLQGKVNEAKKVLADLDELKRQEDDELVHWQTEVGDIEQRLDLMNRILMDAN
tara:strand:- start:73 stop:315 length:243 start_codon:yes stop_codon:yes gene_type:complete